VRAALAAIGAQVLRLPPYSPDPDPIEQALVKLQTVSAST
jgi:transposase